jgi:phosphosulfolactate synthase
VPTSRISWPQWATYLDFAKIKSGTARLYPRSVLQRKIEIYKANNIMPFIGGQFHEYVLATEGAKATAQFYDEAKRLGFAAIEISDNVVTLTDQERSEHIRAACDSGLEVFGEVGGKDRSSKPEELLSQAQICLAAGARLVLVEAAELVVDGKPDRQLLNVIYRGLDPEQVMIELPGPWIPGVRSCDIEVLKKLLVTEFGPDVNIAMSASIPCSTLKRREMAWGSQARFLPSSYGRGPNNDGRAAIDAGLVERRAMACARGGGQQYRFTQRARCRGTCRPPSSDGRSLWRALALTHAPVRRQRRSRWRRG